MTESFTILFVGGTGSIGRRAAARAAAAGYRVRVLTRRSNANVPAGAFAVTGDLTDVSTLTAAVADIDAVVFTHGAAYQSPLVRDVDYGGVLNILKAIGKRRVRIALMTAIGVTNRAGGHHDWKRRSERLVRASGHPYTIVRPSWFDYNSPSQHELHFLQGDTRWAGSPADGVISRAQLAEVLVASLTSPAATGKTFELVAEQGPAQTDLEPLFAALSPDDGINGASDAANMPLDEEPRDVREDLEIAVGLA